eukprot:6665223-Prymnesium_polylepis.1
MGAGARDAPSPSHGEGPRAPLYDGLRYAMASGLTSRREWSAGGQAGRACILTDVRSKAERRITAPHGRGVRDEVHDLRGRGRAPGVRWWPCVSYCMRCSAVQLDTACGKISRHRQARPVTCYGLYVYDIRHYHRTVKGTVRSVPFTVSKKSRQRRESRKRVECFAPYIS